jgi:hypothetical protein
MPVAPILGFPLLVLFGLVLSGLKQSWVGGESLRFAFVLMTSYMLLAFGVLPPRKLYLLDSLPLSRRVIFAVMVIPMVLALALGYGVGLMVADVKEAKRELIHFVELDCCYGVRVPIEVCEIAWYGDPPPVAAPWGETHEGWTAPLWRGSRAVVYSPFSAPQGSSPDFIALQISRATEAVYGKQVPVEEIRERYMEVGDDGVARPKGDGLTLARDHPGLDPQPRGPVLPVMMLVVCVVWLVAVAFYMRTLRAGISEKARKGVYWGLMLGLLALHMVQFVLATSNFIHLWISAGLWEIAIRNLGTRTPGGALTIWVVNTLIVGGVYLVAQRQFERVESSPGDEKFAELLPLIVKGE